MLFQDLVKEIREILPLNILTEHFYEPQILVKIPTASLLKLRLLHYCTQSI
jgi:hypothetical protein